MGLRRAFSHADVFRGKVFGTILAALSVAILGFFALIVFVGGRRLPASHGAPQVGQKAPEFDLMDTNGKSVRLSELLAAPMNAGRAPKGVLLVFYRGYW
ncbi:MAG TPA: hypothetical protein VEU31_02305 [Candidatus Acidoferrales bacterium]|nr:hypothetical protein [Candidatus Acidoferrales bacterium]